MSVQVVGFILGQNNVVGKLTITDGDLELTNGNIKLKDLSYIYWNNETKRTAIQGDDVANGLFRIITNAGGVYFSHGAAPGTNIFSIADGVSHFTKEFVTGRNTVKYFETIPEWTANQNDLATNADECNFCSASAPIDVTGIAVQGYQNGTLKTFLNTGTNAITFKHQSASSLSTNRLNCPGAVDLVLNQYESVTFVRVSGAWTVCQSR